MASVSINITANADDADYESDFGVFDNAGSGVLAGHTSVKAVDRTYAAGFRFLNVNVPQGTVVTSATLTLDVLSVGGTPNNTLRGDDVDDAPAWADTAGNRPGTLVSPTTATVNPGVTTTGLIEIDVKGPVDEIFARGGWLPNNAMRFDVVDNSGTGNNNFNSAALDGAFTEANLTIVFPSGDYEMPHVDYRSAFAVTSDGAPIIHEGDALSLGSGISSAHEEGLGIVASISSDATWRLRFWMPPTLPSGTAKLKVWGLADAVAGTMQIRPWWASVAAGEDPSSATLNDEGATTLTWAADQDDTYKEAKITLDADTIVAGEMVIMDLVFEAASTLAVPSAYHVAIIWE